MKERNLPRGVNREDVIVGRAGAGRSIWSAHPVRDRRDATFGGRDRARRSATIGGARAPESRPPDDQRFLDDVRY